MRNLSNRYRTKQVPTTNPQSRKALSAEEREKINDVAIEDEIASVHWMEEWRLMEDERLRAAGVKDVALEGKAAKERLDAAQGAIPKELKSASSALSSFRPLTRVQGEPNRQATFATGPKLRRRRPAGTRGRPPSKRGAFV